MKSSLLEIVDNQNIELIEDKLPIKKLKGLYFDNTIVLNSKINTEAEKNCILAEELGHYSTSSGNILGQEKIVNVKQELKARRWAASELIKVDDFVRAFEAGVRNRFELAEFLEVTEEFIGFALAHFYSKHGESYDLGNYTVYFNPLGVLKRL